MNPKIEIHPVDPLTVSFGISIQRIETQFPAARNELSNAFATALRLTERWENSTLGNYGVEGGYSLRAATSSLDSDFVYARHALDGRWWMNHNKDTLVVSFAGGLMTGRAPLFERFVLGNSTTLRGYNKYDIAPFGGNRVAHGSLDYSHRFVRLVYDVGTVWDDGTTPQVKHSMAVGLTARPGEVVQDSITFLVAFPLKRGSVNSNFHFGYEFLRTCRCATRPDGGLQPFWQPQCGQPRMHRVLASAGMANTSGSPRRTFTFSLAVSWSGCAMEQRSR